MFVFQDRRGSVEVAFTDREVDLRDGPAAGAGLATVGRELGAGVLGVAAMHQVHGADVAVIDGRPLETHPEADALVTARPGWILASRAADCVPVLLADPAGGIVAAAHAGRKGMAAGVVTRAAAVMRDLGAQGLVAWVGPHACGRCYEVPADLRDQVVAAVPEAYAETSWGTPALDLGAGVTAQLRAAGAEVIPVDRCTIEDEALFSYRREGAAAGRHAGLVWVRP